MRYRHKYSYVPGITLMYSFLHLLSIFDPYGNAVHTALSFNMVGEDVIITGAGPIGIMAAMVAGHCGARNIILTDINEYRLDLAKRIVPRVQPINVAKQEGTPVGIAHLITKL